MIGKMQKIIIVELTFSTVFVITKFEDGFFSQEQINNTEMVKRKDQLDSRLALELSIHLFTKKISQLSQDHWQLNLIRANKAHLDWIDSLSENKNISLVCFPNYKDVSISTENISQFKQSLFNFESKANILDIQSSLQNINKTTIANFPQQYLLASFNGKFQISLVKSETKRIVYQSSLGEQFHLDILSALLDKKNLIKYNLDHIITSAISKGDISITDLFVEDIFGKEKCAFIGLPPKLLAASMGKIATGAADKRTIWDQIKSILVAFAINIGKQISLSKMSTGVHRVIFAPGQFSNPYFLKIIEGLTILKKVQIGFIDDYLFKRFLSDSLKMQNDEI